MLENYMLNVAMKIKSSKANGPGNRAVIWVQGCTIGCRGCYNSFTHPHEAKEMILSSDLAKWIASIDNIDGVTFSGGEPFEQAAAIDEVLSNLHKMGRNDLTVFIFTGYDYEYLINSEEQSIAKLLSKTDILSAGVFDFTKKSDELLWRGSDNQQLIYLSDRYSSSDESFWLNHSPLEEISFHDGNMIFTGFKGKSGDLYKSVLDCLN